MMIISHFLYLITFEVFFFNSKLVEIPLMHSYRKLNFIQLNNENQQSHERQFLLSNRIEFETLKDNFCS